MKRSQVISCLVALGFGCTIGALALAMSGEVAAARELGAAELAAVIGGNEDAEFFQNKTCNPTQQCHHLNFSPSQWCGVGPGVGQACRGCEQEDFVDYTCVGTNAQDCQLGGTAGDEDCGKKTLGTCSPGFACIGGTVLGEGFCECDARMCDQE